MLLKLLNNQLKHRGTRAICGLALVLFLAACGQRGPLYLPEPEQAPAEINETEAKETEAKETEDNGTEDDKTEDDETEDDETEDDREKTTGT